MRFSMRATALAGLAALAVAGCGSPGGSSADTQQRTEEQANTTAEKPDVAAAGDVTLTVWDQEVRGGQNRQMKRLNAAFQEQYPNVTIKRVSRSFDDLQRTLRLAVSGDDAPDVVQANQGRGVMGTLVKGGLLRPIEGYREAYGWNDRYAETLLDLNSFSSDGNQFGEGDLYGLSQMGEIVGVFYNKTKVDSPPETLADFEASLKEAKAEDDIPIQFGNLDAWPGIHNYETVLAQTADKQAIRDFVFARDGGSFEAAGFEDAAAKMQEWADADYFTPNFNGVGYDPAWQRFARGEGRFLIAGTWIVADLAEQMGDDVGFMLMPGQEAGSDPVALGGESLPFATTQKSENPEVAAAYIDFITNSDAARVLAETNNLPAMNGAPQDAVAEGLPSEVFEQWTRLTESDGFVPYLDYATPTFYDDVSAGIQTLAAGREEPSAFVSSMQQKFTEFTESLN